MSRVTYSDTPTTPDQEALRLAHRVRVVADAEEGAGLQHLPTGVYGFTYSPGLSSAPLFAVRRFRNYEVHKLESGDVFVIGFARSDAARELSTNSTEISLQIHPQPEGEFATLVTVPYSRIRQHRQYAAPNQDGFFVTVVP